VNIILKLWRGDVPLYITFWFFGMIIGTIVSTLVTKHGLVEPVAPAGTRVFWLLLALLYTGFMSVALWRSAGKHKGYPLWSVAARFYSAILFLSCISFFINIFYVFYSQ